MTLTRLLLIAGLGTSASAQQPAPAPPAPRATTTPAIAIVNVTVLPMDKPRVLKEQTVLIVGDRIAKVGAARVVEVPSGARFIDGSGKYLIPGLVDSHVHLAGNSPDDQRALLDLFLANGVTTVLNMRGTPQMLELRAAVAAGMIRGPRIYTVGPYVNEPAVTTPDGVEQAVVEQKKAGYDFVKLHGDLSREAYARLISVAKREAIRVIGHAPRNLGVDAMFEEKQYALAHAEEFLYDRQNRSTDSSLPAVRARIPELARRTAEAGIWVMPNLTAYKMIARMVQNLDTVLARPDVRCLPRGVQEGWGPATNPYTNRFDSSRYEPFMARYALLEEMVRQFKTANVRMLVGTDAMNTGVVPGFSVHDELADLVHAGLDRFTTLRAATATGAEFFADPGRHGIIAAAQPADLVLLDADPLADIANTRRIAAVVVRGTAYTRAQLNELLKPCGGE